MLRRYDDNSALRWIESNGGPLLLVPGEHLPSWGGVVPPTDGRRIDATFRAFPGEPASDYDRACDVEDYLGLLAIGSGYGLILGGEPCATAWLTLAASGDGDERTARAGKVVRWVYAESESEVMSAVEHVPPSAWRDDDVVLTVGREPMYLLDAAYNLSSLKGDNHLMINLPAGTYAIATAEYEPDSHTSLILHQLTWIGTSE